MLCQLDVSFYMRHVESSWVDVRARNSFLLDAEAVTAADARSYVYFRFDERHLSACASGSAEPSPCRGTALDAQLRALCASDSFALLVSHFFNKYGPKFSMLKKHVRIYHVRIPCMNHLVWQCC